MDYKNPLSEDDQEKEDILGSNQTDSVIMQNSISSGVVPEEIKRWNWGAFMFNISWGFGNKSYLPLLTLIPFFYFIWIFVCGAKGNEWAWKKGNYKTVEEFMKVQETWNRAGLISFIILLVLIVLYILFVVYIGVALFSGRPEYGSYY